MKIETQKFNDQEISVMPTKTTNMGIDKEGMVMAMKMVTTDLYSNVIGSVVREIGSNCVDSHVEAEVDLPWKLKLLYEESGIYASFQDFGVGMNPERVETVYGKYYNSTKRDNNDEIGGFGIGGKSPMAYGESFFVITVANKEDDVQYTKNIIANLKKGLHDIREEEKIVGEGNGSALMEFLISKYGTSKDLDKEIKFLTKRLKAVEAIEEERIMYHYNIFKGEVSAVIQELYFHGTTDSKGTEVKIPIKKDDINTFTSEIKRQLFYFNNVIFEGWDGSVTDDYTLYRGKSFVYRGDDYERNVHVCLGNVAYPINFRSLGLDSYGYGVPVAIVLNVGDVDVTPSREALLYSEKTINVLKGKMEEVQAEILEIYKVQTDNVVSLEEYFIFKNENQHIKLGEDMVNVSNFVPSDFKPKNFKYADLKIKDSTDLFELAFNYNKVGITKRSGGFNSLSYSYIRDVKNNSRYHYTKQIFFSDTFVPPNNYKKMYIKQNMDHCGSGHVVATLRKLKLADLEEKERCGILQKLGIIKYDSWEDKINEWCVEEKKGKRLINKLIKDLVALVRKELPTYNFEAPEDFINDIKASRKRKRNGTDVTLGLRDAASYDYAFEMKLSHLKEYKGRIFYSLKEDEDSYSPLDKAKRAHDSVFGSKFIEKPYYEGRKIAKSKKGIMFVRIRKNQVNHIAKLPNSFHAKHYYKVMLSRKYNDFVTYYKKRNLEAAIDHLPRVLNHEDFKKLAPKVSVSIRLVEREIKAYKTPIKSSMFDSWYGITNEKIFQELKLDSGNKECKDFKSKKPIKILNDFMEKNTDTLSYFNIKLNEPFTEKLVMLLDLALER